MMLFPAADAVEEGGPSQLFGKGSCHAHTPSACTRVGEVKEFTSHHHRSTSPSYANSLQTRGSHGTSQPGRTHTSDDFSVTEDSWSLCPTTSPSTIPLSALDELFAGRARRRGPRASEGNVASSQPAASSSAALGQPIIDDECPSGTQEDDELPQRRLTTPPPNAPTPPPPAVAAEPHPPTEQRQQPAKRPPPIAIHFQNTVLTESVITPPTSLATPAPPSARGPQGGGCAPRPRTASTSTHSASRRVSGGHPRSPRDPSFFTVSSQQSSSQPFLLEVPYPGAEASFLHTPTAGRAPLSLHHHHQAHATPPSTASSKRNSTSLSAGSSSRTSQGRKSLSTPPTSYVLSPPQHPSSVRSRAIVLHCVPVTEVASAYSRSTPASSGFSAARAKRQAPTPPQLDFYDDC